MVARLNGRKVLVDLLFGIGYARCTERISNWNFAVDGALIDRIIGFEYRCSKHVGVGINANTILSAFPDGFPSPQVIPGLGCECGMRFYFN